MYHPRHPKFRREGFGHGLNASNVIEVQTVPNAEEVQPIEQEQEALDPGAQQVANYINTLATEPAAWDWRTTLQSLKALATWRVQEMFAGYRPRYRRALCS